MHTAFEQPWNVHLLFLSPFIHLRAKNTEIAHSLRATQKAKLDACAHTAQKKKEAITSADKTASVILKKRTRSEIEAEDDTEIQGGVAYAT